MPQSESAPGAGTNGTGSTGIQQIPAEAGARLSIGALSRATGIPVETLRTWEARYGFPVPERRPSGHRVYAASVVPRLRRVAEALARGHRAGNVLTADDADLTRRARAGDFYTLIRDTQDEVLSFEYQHGREKVYRVRREPGGELVASGEDVPLERRVVQLAVLVENSLFASVLELGEGPDLVQAFSVVFLWDIDFSTQVRPGDEFRMLVKKFYDSKGFVRYGRMLAAEYRGTDRTHSAIYYEDETGYGDYFTPEGRSVRRSWLRAPVEFTRISSGFIEQANAAIVLEDLSLMDGLRRGWEVVKSNLGPALIMGLILFVISFVVGLVIAIPLFLAIFPSLLGYFASNGENTAPLIFMSVCFCLYLPVALVLQGIMVAFTGSAWTLTYMRLTKPPQDNTPVALEANA